MKRLTALLLTFMMILSAVLTGCGGSSGGSTGESGGSTAGNSSAQEPAASAETIHFAGGIKEYVLYGTYNSEFFANSGSVDKKILKSVENMTYITRTLNSGETIDLSAVPVSMKIHRANDLVTECSNLYSMSDWQELYGTLMAKDPATADQYLENIHALYDMSVAEVAFIDEKAQAYGRYQYIYTMDGTTMKCREITGIADDYTPVYDENQPESEYEIAFAGDSMIISRNGTAITLLPDQKWDRTQGNDEFYYLQGSIAKDEDAYQDIASISLTWKKGEEESSGISMVRFTDGSYSDPIDTKGVLTEPNTVTITWDERMTANKDVYEEDGKLTLTFLNGGSLLTPYVVLLDEQGNTYPYQSWYSKYVENKAADNIGDEVSTEDLSEEELGKIVEDQEEVVSSLHAEFNVPELSALVDENSGTVRFDSSLLFAVDSADISEEGLAQLDSFLEAYIPIMQKHAESGTVAKIEIDGHTDTNGDHAYNQELSERRAKAVADYVTAAYPEIAPYIVSKGYSYDKPIFADDGSVDMDASRRVEFRFIMNAGE